MTEKNTQETAAKVALLKTIEDVWLKHPELRFCQLIGNCFPAGDNYYKEDFELARELYNTYKD